MASNIIDTVRIIISDAERASTTSVGLAYRIRHANRQAIAASCSRYVSFLFLSVLRDLLSTLYYRRFLEAYDLRRHATNASSATRILYNRDLSLIISRSVMAAVSALRNRSIMSDQANRHASHYIRAEDVTSEDRGACDLGLYRGCVCLVVLCVDSALVGGVYFLINSKVHIASPFSSLRLSRSLSSSSAS